MKGVQMVSYSAMTGALMTTDTYIYFFLGKICKVIIFECDERKKLSIHYVINAGLSAYAYALRAFVTLSSTSTSLSSSC